MGDFYKQNTTDLRQLFPGNFNRAQKIKILVSLYVACFFAFKIRTTFFRDNKYSAMRRVKSK